MKTLTGILVFSIWCAICNPWYVCGIRELCNENKIETSLPATDASNVISMDKDQRDQSQEFTPTADTLKFYSEFDSDTFKIKSVDQEEVDDIVAFMQNRPGQIVLIVGHADSIGTAKYNKNLGLERAKSVRNYLKIKGVDDELIQIKTMGERDPEVTYQHPKAFKKNRRIEIFIK